MFTFTARTFTLATVSLGLLTLLPIQSFQPEAMAQKADETYVAVITGDDVYVRSGPSDSYYPFTKLSSGITLAARQGGACVTAVRTASLTVARAQKSPRLENGCPATMLATSASLMPLTSVSESRMP